MFEHIRRLLHADQVDAYVAKVATALISEGFDPVHLDELNSATAFEHSGRLFELLRERRLPAEDAAHAIRLATGLYHKTKYMAAAEGWPLKNETTGLPRHEAYFLELLGEAAASLRRGP